MGPVYRRLYVGSVMSVGYILCGVDDVACVGYAV